MGTALESVVYKTNAADLTLFSKSFAVLQKGMIIKMFFYRRLEQYGGRTALVSSDGTKLTYSELAAAADEFSAAVSPRSLVFLLCRNCVETVVGYTACMRGEAVAAMLGAGIDGSLLEELLDSYRPSYIWLPAESCILADRECVYRYGDYKLIKTDYEKDYTINTDLKLLLTTSGSTGSPKFVRQTERNIQSNTESIVKYLEIREDDAAITTMPMNYTYGLSILNTHLFCGARIILCDYTLMDKQFWSLMKTQGATTFGGVPYIYEMLKKLHFERMDIPTLRYLTQAGGKLSPELADEFSEICRQKDMKFIIMYGQTEATARMSYRPWESAFSKSASIGIAIPGGTLELIDTEGKPITEPDKVGEMIYRGDNVTMGYAESRYDLIKGDENCGVLVTGDMAKRDADGYYYVVGRKKRFLKLFGNRVNLDEVEQLLRKQNIDCACGGQDDNMVIYITDESFRAPTADYIDHHTAISHGGYKIKIIDKIPRSDSGKILYSELK